MAFTAHGYLCLEEHHRVPDDVLDHSRDAYGGLTDPRLVTALAGPDAGARDVDSLDLLLVADAIASDPTGLQLREEPDHRHPRVDFARRVRDAVRAFTVDGLEDSVVVLATGVGGLTEVSIEVAPQDRGHGVAAAMLTAVRATLDSGEIVIAMVAPGNAVSLRAFLSAGFVPIGSAQLWLVT